MTSARVLNWSGLIRFVAVSSELTLGALHLPRYTAHEKMRKLVKSMQKHMEKNGGVDWKRVDHDAD